MATFAATRAKRVIWPRLVCLIFWPPCQRLYIHAWLALFLRSASCLAIPNLQAYGMATSTIPMPTTSSGRMTKTAVFSRRISHCKVKAVATSPRALCPKGSMTDYYKVLSLEHSAAVGAEEIKRAYRRLALRYHPDVCPPSRRGESTELFLELRRAYETLSDPAQRLRYDAELRAGGEDPAAGVAFARDVWEAQLCALRARSEQRQSARSGGVRTRRARA